VSVDTGDRKLSYIWEGSHPKQPNDPYQGFGWITFDDAPGSFSSGRGLFFNANLADLKTSRRKSIVFRRCIDEKEIETMTGSNGQLIKTMVLEKLGIW
jgi:hypothetical protein